MSNVKMFKYEWIWEKTRPTGFFTAKKMPMKIHENILVFYKQQPTYNPEKIKADESKIDKRKTLNPTYSPYLGVIKERVKDSGMRYPLTIQTFNSISEKGQHPTQKPVALFEYLIKTYTNEGDLVLDNCAGSGTTGVACKNLNRNYILIEKEPKYIEIIKKRLANL
jgi:site-specific DNA-methyltransferase (adenine-specific)